MFDRRKIEYTYLKLSKKIKDFLLSDKSREFLIFLFFFLIAGGFWLLQTDVYKRQESPFQRCTCRVSGREIAGVCRSFVVA